jgi:hypothetical protein
MAVVSDPVPGVDVTDSNPMGTKNAKDIVLARLPVLQATRMGALVKFLGGMKADMTFVDFVEYIKQLNRKGVDIGTTALGAFVDRIVMAGGASPAKARLNAWLKANMKAQVDKWITEYVKQYPKARQAYKDIEAYAKAKILQSVPWWVEGAIRQTWLDNRYARLATDDTMRGWDLFGTWNPYTSRHTIEGGKSILDIIDSFGIQIQGSLHFAERFAAAAAIAGMIRFYSEYQDATGTLPATFTLDEIERLRGSRQTPNAFVERLAIAETIKLVDGYFTSKQSITSPMFDAMLDLITTGNRKPLADILTMVKGGKKVGMLSPLAVQENILRQLVGAALNQRAAPLPKGLTTRRVYDAINGLQCRPLTQVVNPEITGYTTGSKEATLTIDATYTGGTQEVRDVLVESKFNKKMDNAEQSKMLASAFDSVQGWVFNRKTFAELWMVVSQDSRYAGGHLPGFLDFVNNKVPGDTRFQALVNDEQTDATRGVYTYDARSRIPLKMDAYKQDLLREYIAQYLKSKTAAQKAALTVGDMEEWIVMHHGSELGMTALPNAAEGIPDISELRLAVNRHQDSSGVWEIWRGGIDLETMEEWIKLDGTYGDDFLKINSQLTLAQYENLLTPKSKQKISIDLIEGFFFETRDYTLRVLELNVDRAAVIRENIRLMDLLCAWAGVPNVLRSTTGEWWNV